MKVLKSCFFFFIWLAIFGVDCNGQQKNESGLRVVDLQGSARERGRIHGKTLRKDIRNLVKSWKGWMRSTYKMDSHRFVKKFLDETRHLEAAKKWTPDLIEEIRGIAEGAEIDFDTMFAFQLVDEIWAQGPSIAQHHCTALAVNRRGDQPTMVAQNLDIPQFYHGFQTILRIDEPGDKPDKLVVTFAGLVGANGLNDQSIGVSVNTLLQLQPASDGLPVAFVVRGILDCHSFDDAVDFIKSINHASGQNYIIGDSRQATSFECSEKSVALYLPFKGSKFTYHTNHPLVNDNFRASHLDMLKSLDRTVEQGARRCNRFASLQKRIRPDSEIDLSLIKKTLSSKDHSWDRINNTSTFACTIMVLADHPKLLIAAGAPDKEEFQQFEFK